MNSLSNHPRRNDSERDQTDQEALLNESIGVNLENLEQRIGAVSIDTEESEELTVASLRESKQIQEESGAEEKKLIEEIRNIPDLPSEWLVKPDAELINEFLKLQRNTCKDKSKLRPLGGTRSCGRMRLFFMKLFGIRRGNPIEHNGILTLKINGELWELGRRSRRNTVLRKVNDHATVVMLPKNASLTRESLVKWSKKAIEYRRSEVLDEAGMSRGFEIAGKEPLAFIEVADLSNKLSQKTAEDFSGFPMVMAKRYNVFMAPGSRIDVSKENDPMSRLRAQVDLYYQKGVRNFYFSVLLHGTKDAIVMGNKKIPPSAFSEMFREYSDCRFTMNAVSCYGGGLADEMEQFVDYPGAQEGRVSVFMQTKEDVINYAAVTGDDYSTLYNAALSVYLMQGIDNRSGKKLTYGEAHLLADRYAKIHGFNDAEVFCSRPDRKSAFVRAKKYS